MRLQTSKTRFWPEPVSPQLRKALDRQVLRALSPVSSGLAVAFVVFVVLSLLDNLSTRATITIVGLDVASIVVLLCLHAALRRSRVPVRGANAVGLGVVALSLANIMTGFALTQDPIYLNFLTIVVVACGSFLLSLRWLLASFGVTMVSTVPFTWRLLTTEQFSQFWLVLTAAAAVAVIVLVVRRRVVLGFERALAGAREESTRRRRAEASLQESERRMELAIAGSQGGWWDIEMDPDNPETVPDAMNLDPSVKAFIGFEDDEFPNSVKRWKSRILKADQKAHSTAMRDHVAGRTPLYEVEYRIRHKTGGVRWLYSRGQIQRDSDGRPLRWSGLDWDITDSKRAEARLLLLTRAVEQSPSLVIITDTEGQIEYVNPKLLRTTGYSLDELVGRKPSLFKSDATPAETHTELWRAITVGREWQGEFRNKKKDGTDYWVISSVSPIKNAKGVIQHYLAVQEDVTERKKVEAQLVQAQNLESVGQLVSGVAHDFNNLLTAVIGFAELGLRKTTSESPLHRDLSEIKKAGVSAGDLTRQLLAFSRRQMLEPRVLSLNDVVSEVEGLLRRTISEDIVLDLALDPHLGSAKVDPAQMTQILVNLAINARDAMPEGGRLTIETRDVEFDGDQFFGSARAAPGPYVMLAVTDTGHGIDEETQGRVFEPFFTTKKRGQGTGLGLSTVYGVVKQSGGFVTLTSEVNVGTTFKVFFPRVAENAEPQQSEIVADTRGGSETILLVEDNAGVRKVAAQTLESRGYRVFSCGEAKAAMRLFSKHDIDLLLTDVVMPGTNGATLAQDLKSELPSLRVLLMSGYTERAVLDAQFLGPDTPFLHKPFRLDDLLAKVRHCFERVE